MLVYIASYSMHANSPEARDSEFVDQIISIATDKKTCLTVRWGKWRTTSISILLLALFHVIRGSLSMTTLCGNVDCVVWRFGFKRCTHVQLSSLYLLSTFSLRATSHTWFCLKGPPAFRVKQRKTGSGLGTRLRIWLLQFLVHYSLHSPCTLNWFIVQDGSISVQPYEQLRYSYYIHCY